MPRGRKPKISGIIHDPDFDKMQSIYENDIAPANKDQRRAMKDASDAWKEAKKDAHVHTGGARTAYKVIGMEDAERDVWLRSFYGVLAKNGVGLRADLVDQMHGDQDENEDGEGFVPPPTLPVETSGLATLN